jgi:DNA-binding MarR family transcriptional regulator
MEPRAPAAPAVVIAANSPANAEPKHSAGKHTSRVSAESFEEALRAVAEPGATVDELTDSQRMFILMLQAGRTIQDKVEAAVLAHGESFLQFRPLAIVVRFGPQTQQDIATLTAQHPAGVSRIVDELEERKLVRRVRGEQDRRTVRVEPTDAGRALFAKVNPAAMGALESALSPLNERERKAFYRALERIVSAHNSG